MERHFITALLVVILLAPQSGLEAKSRHHGVKDRDHDAEDRDHEANKRHRYSRYKKYIKKYRHSDATNADLELLKQPIAEINAKMDALEPQSQLPADLEAKLNALQMAVDANSSDVSLALSDLVGLLMDIEKIDINTGQIDDLKLAVAGLVTRIDLLEPIVEDHESRIFALENSAFVGVSFSALFTGEVAADDTVLEPWFTFKSKATGWFSSIEIKNNLPGPEVKCTDRKLATGIAKALKESIPGLVTTFTCPSDGRLWNVIPYGNGVELNSWTNSLEGQCETYASVRPFGPGYIIGVVWVIVVVN